MADQSTLTAIRVEDFLSHQKSDEKIIQKAIDVEIDQGNLMNFDVNEMNIKEFRKDREQFLLVLSKGNVQLLIDSLRQLPVDNSQGVNVVKLPEPATTVPREKVVPKARQPTKWEQYARLKGIQSKKKSRMVWDNETQQYRPRWGYKSKDESKSWVLEVPDNADPMEDQFAKKKKEKQERIEKNEMQRLRNIARTTKSKVPGVGLTPTSTQTKDQLATALAVTHRSTASLGQFMETLPKEKLKGLGKKRKFDSNDMVDEEKSRQKKILKRISEATPILNVNRAVNASQHNEERQRAASKTAEDGQRRKKAGGKGQKRSKQGFSGKGGKSGGKGGKSGGKGGKSGGKGGKSFGGKGGKSFSGKGKKGGRK